MHVVDLIGWTATVLGATVGLPQLIRLVRTRSVEGVSLVAWQAMLVLGIAYAAHGLSIGQLPQVVSTTVQIVTIVPVLVLMSAQLGRRPVGVLAPAMALAGGLIAVDQFVGATAFGVLAIAPAIVANAGQSVELVRSPDVRGVSIVFTVLAVVNPAIWLVWGAMIQDPGTMISSATAASIAAFNLVWYLARRVGLRPFFAGRTVDAPLTDSPRPELVGVGA